MRISTCPQCAGAPEWWEPVVGAEGFYQVSTHGRVRSLARVTIDMGGRRTRRFPSKVLSPAYPTHKYAQVSLSVEGKAWRQTIHVLMAEAFLGPRPDGAWVCHEDDVRLHLHLGNIGYKSPADNFVDAVRNGRRVGARGDVAVCPYGHRIVGRNRTPDGHCRACNNARRLGTGSPKFLARVAVTYAQFMSTETRFKQCPSCGHLVDVS